MFILVSQVCDDVKNLNTTRFAGFKEYHMGDVLLQPLCENMLKWKSVFASIVRGLLLEDYAYTENRGRNANIFFLYSHSYTGRPEFAGYFRDLLSLVEGQHSMVAEACGWHLNSRHIFNVFYFPVWVWQMRGLRRSIKQKCYLAANMLSCKKWERYLRKKVDAASYNALITFCDFHMIDSLTTEYFSLAGKHTATLQHGEAVFGSDANAGTNRPFTISDYSNSKHWLVWNNLAVEEIDFLGADRTRAIVVGPLRYIKSRRPAPASEQPKVLGVVLGSLSAYQDDALRLLEIARGFEKEHNYRCFFRLHPANYEDYLDYLDIGEHETKTTWESVSDFADQVEFAISTALSTFPSELACLNKRVYIRKNDLGYSTLFNLPFHYFQTQEELNNLFAHDKEHPEEAADLVQKLKSQLYGPDDVAGAYRDYLQKYL